MQQGDATSLYAGFMAFSVLSHSLLLNLRKTDPTLLSVYLLFQASHRGFLKSGYLSLSRGARTSKCRPQTPPANAATCFAASMLFNLPIRYEIMEAKKCFRA
jgi:hypothetical protein